MNASPLESILGSWSLDPSILIATVVTAAIYVRGWQRLRHEHADRFGHRQLAAFLGGLACLLVAICSPLDAFGSMLLWVHMTQHVILLMVVPPLLLIARPAGPLLRGLPTTLLANVVGPALAHRRVRAIGDFLSTPVIAVSIFILATWVWHIPSLYEAALIDPFWHRVEHATFLAASIIFWFPVIRPWPAKPLKTAWIVIPYLLVADLQNTLFSAIFCFSDRVLYPTYHATAPLMGWSPLDDQALAGAIMWIPGSVVFLLPLGILFAHVMRPPMIRPAVIGHTSAAPEIMGGGGLPILGRPLSSPAPQRRHQTWNLLKTPVVGAIATSLTARRGAQWLLLVIAAVIIADGIFGPQVTSMNLAGVVPWTHGRGLVIIALLLVGNLFCAICPLTLPRSLLGRVAPRPRSVPKWLATKWTVVVLIILYLWAYEAFSLWASPWLTAWIIAGYFFGALFFDLVFPAGTFCRHVCPIGHFNGVISLLSPTHVGVRDLGVCATCTSKACLRGTKDAPGCPANLLQPKKHGNLECTACMNCARSCPHDNIAVLGQAQGAELARDRARSGVGRFTTRPDVAALVVVLSVGGLANAAGMTGPALAMEDRLVDALHLDRHSVIAGLAFLSLVLLPLAAITAAAFITTTVSQRRPRETVVVACRFSMTLLPLGAAMWACHMLFHFLTSWLTIVPVAQRAALDIGIDWGVPNWVMSCCGPMPSWLIPLELAILGVGLVMSVWLTGRVGQDLGSTRRGWGVMTLPWLIVHGAFWVGAVWVVLQPMQMRGTLLP